MRDSAVRSGATLGALVLVATPIAAGGVIDLAEHQPDITLLGTRNIEATGDLDGDGLEDLVVSWNGDPAIIFSAPPGEIPTTIDLRPSGPDVIVRQRHVNDVSVADVSGDGIGDLIVSAAYEVFALYGRSDWPAEIDPDQVPPDLSVKPLYGPSQWWPPSMTAGDFDGDGLVELAVSGPGFACPDLDPRYDAGGAVFLFWSRDGTGLLPDVSDPYEQADAVFCQACTSSYNAALDCPNLGAELAAGDLNGDGRTDLAIGAPHGSASSYHNGLAHLFLAQHPGKGRPFPRRTDLFPFRRASGETLVEGAMYEYHTSEDLGVLDFNRDGFDDLMVYTYHAYLTHTREERYGAGDVRVLLGGARRFPSPIIRFVQKLTDWNMFGAEERDATAYRDIATGDVNRDGYADLLVDQPFADGPGNTRTTGGEAHLFLGYDLSAGEGPVVVDLQEDEPDLLVYGARDNDRLGAKLADLDGDGYDDLVLTVDRHPDPENPARVVRAIQILLSPYRP